MKRIAIFAAIVLLSFSGAYAQNSNKPFLFSQYANIINCPESELSRVFAVAETQQVTLTLGNGFIYSGTVISNTFKNQLVQSVIIRSAQFSNAIFQITRRMSDAGTYIYGGRIVNDDFADGYNLKKENTTYSLVKTASEKERQPCNQ